jgi:hypothetical protein
MRWRLTDLQGNSYALLLSKRSGRHSAAAVRHLGAARRARQLAGRFRRLVTGPWRQPDDQSADDFPPVSPPPTDEVLREQSIYIPYTKLRETFEKEGRGVFLPYDKFQELWRAARAATTKPPEHLPPVGALITAIESQATVERDVLRVDAKLQIELLTPGWHKVPLRLGDAALLAAQINGQPAQVVFENNGYWLLIKAASPSPPPSPDAKPSEKPTEKPGDKPTEKPQEKPAEKPAEKPGEKPEATPSPTPTPSPDAAKPDSTPEPKVEVKRDNKPEEKPATPAGGGDSAPASPPTASAEAARPAFPQRVELSLEYAKAYAKHPGLNSVSFEAPQAPVNRWQIRIAQSGTKITIEPLIAASEIPTAPAASTSDAKPDGAKPEGAKPESPKPDKPAEQTVLQAFVGAAPTVKVDWTAKSEGAAGLAALVNVQARQQVRIDEGVVRVQTQLAYEISRADVGQLQVELPADQRVINVFDPNVRQWDVKPAGEGKQRVNVQLFQPTRGRQNLVVETEKFLDEMKRDQIVAPVVQAIDVVRQQGIVLVKLAPELKAEVARRVGLTQLDSAELPKELAGQAWDFTFRYATLPFDLAFQVDKVQPRVTVDELVEVYLEPERISAELLALYTIERAGVFQVELNVPEGYELREVRGQKVGDSEAAVVDSHRLEGEKKDRLIVSFPRKALGKVGLWVRLEKRLSDPNLAQPTGKSSQYELPLPRVTPTSVENETGRLVIYSPESLRLHAQDLEGLRPIAAQEAFQTTPSQRGSRFSNTREVLAYAFGKPAAKVNLAAERRRPAVNARQMLVARLETGVVKYQATFFYQVQYSGVKSLRIDIPQAIAERVHNDTPNYREKPLEKPDPAPAEGYVAWSFTGDTELLGDHTLKLVWETPLEELAIGANREITIPRLTPKDAELERAWGQVVVTKAETLDIRPTGTPEGLRPIDPRHDLMPGVTIADAARAFEFQADWKLALASAAISTGGSEADGHRKGTRPHGGHSQRQHDRPGDLPRT